MAKKSKPLSQCSLNIKNLDYNWRKPRALVLVEGEFGCLFYALYKDVKVPYYEPKGKMRKATRWLVKIDNRIKNVSFLSVEKAPKKIQFYVGRILEKFNELTCEDLPIMLRPHKGSKSH